MGHTKTMTYVNMALTTNSQGGTCLPQRVHTPLPSTRPWKFLFQSVFAGWVRWWKSLFCRIFARCFSVGLDPHQQQQESSSSRCWNLNERSVCHLQRQLQIANLNITNMANCKCSSCFQICSVYHRVERLKQTLATRNQTSNQQFSPISAILECKCLWTNDCGNGCQWCPKSSDTCPDVPMILPWHFNLTIPTQAEQNFVSQALRMMCDEVFWGISRTYQTTVVLEQAAHGWCRNGHDTTQYCSVVTTSTSWASTQKLEIENKNVVSLCLRKAMQLLGNCVYVSWSLLFSQCYLISPAMINVHMERQC